MSYFHHLPKCDSPQFFIQHGVQRFLAFAGFSPQKGLIANAKWF
jgi:hypothetical protein